ncbi:MAG: hypothetical protein V3T60_13395, partial [Candidatus Binatia bacterium]
SSAIVGFLPNITFQANLKPYLRQRASIGTSLTSSGGSGHNAQVVLTLRTGAVEVFGHRWGLLPDSSLGI